MNDIFYKEIITASFLRRPNRFVVECDLGGETVKAHLPNPGRMWELLFPGRLLYLTPSAGVGKSTAFKVVGIEREGTPIMLDTHFSNKVAELLITQNRIPQLRGWEVIRREVTFGNSRFDLLLGRGTERFIIEVKSCTLFGKKTAMFPDAITERGRKHLLELADLADQGYRAGVLFLVHWRYGEYFLPDYHTDLAFSQTFYELRNKVEFMAIALDWQRDLTLSSRIHQAHIPWEIIGREAQDGGNYIFILHLPEDKTINIGSKSEILFRKGYYLYVGSAKINLTKRLERHQRKRKNFHWHIDYLRDQAEYHAAIPIRTTSPLEHDIAAAIGEIADWAVPGFGSSDCNCHTHLFGMVNDPIKEPAFIDLLQYFRMDRLEEELQQFPVG